jgi:predicted anti-sigma-YlaC factor YlaD
VNAELCEHWRGLLALDAVGALATAEQAPLRAHLEQCGSCRRERDELARTAQVLPAADADHFEEHQMPAHLEEAVLARLGADARDDRRRRRAWVGGGIASGIAAAVVALGLVLAVSSSPATGHTVALHGSQGVSASVRLTSEAWGTAVRLTEHGQPGGQVLWVSMRTTGGDWWEAGTYTTVTGRGVTVDMACALPTSKITEVWVRDAAGHGVLQGYVDHA